MPGPDEPKIITVGEGFYVRQEVDNIAWIDVGEYVVVVDALERAALEEEVFAALARTVGDKPVRYVLNTHTHADHVALNAAFQRRCAAEIVNLRTARIPPEGRWFRGGRRRVLIKPEPGCHTDSDAVIWVPEDRALFTGDLFGWGLIPLTRALDRRTEAMLLAAYGRMVDFGASVVIPGHGPLCSTAELRRWVAYLRWLVREVSDAHRLGRSARRIRDAIGPPEDMTGWWRFVDWKHADSLEKVLGAVRSGRLGG
jgi:cyclase